jgi:hypothetical protein
MRGRMALQKLALKSSEPHGRVLHGVFLEGDLSSRRFDFGSARPVLLPSVVGGLRRNRLRTSALASIVCTTSPRWFVVTLRRRMIA